MYPEIEQRISQLIGESGADLLAGRRIGLEKESLRVSADGVISQTDHPAALGSALCNGEITTDFSEALLEMVTPPCQSAAEALDYLVNIHQFILERLPESEQLWNTSMPCIVKGQSSIRIGKYGNSNTGLMKHAYRRGLGVRYGRRMQAIAGIHFNFSLPESCWPVWRSLMKVSPGVSAQDATTQGYFHMTRNLMRIGWLVPYLFGASPAICQSFLAAGTTSDLDTFNATTRFAPEGTSLRMGNIGYQYREDKSINLDVSHEHFSGYLRDLHAHVSTAHPPYELLGLSNHKGVRQQLNANRLQIENEFYSPVRPKQIPEPGEMPLLAMQRRGIRYLELRSVDVNVFDPVGIHQDEIAMLELLMLFAWLADCAPLDAEELAMTKHNLIEVAHRGRRPGLELRCPEGNMTLQSWALCVLDALEPVAEWLQQSGPVTTDYVAALKAQRSKVLDPSLTPSARVLREIKEHGSFFDFAMHWSVDQQDLLQSMPQNPDIQRHLAELVPASIARQAAMESESSEPLAAYLASYFSQLNDDAA